MEARRLAAQLGASAANGTSNWETTRSLLDLTRKERVRRGKTPQMPVTDPTVTVVVSTYAAERLLSDCLDMVLSQSIGDQLEVIVVDSGSPEREADVIAPYLTDPRVRYVRSERETLYAAWNRALAMSRGRYFANVNTDDWIAPESLQVMASALDTNPDCALAYADYSFTDLPTTPPVPTDPVCTHSPWIPALHLFYCYSGCVQFWRRSSLESIGGYDPSLRYCGDLLALRRLADAGLRAVYVPELLWGFHRNPSGLSLSSEGPIEEQREIHRRARAELRMELLYAVDPDDRRALADAWTALGVLAMRIRVPWLHSPAPDVDFALECFHRALDLVPDHVDALHDRYAVLWAAGRPIDAERSLSHLRPDLAATARGADLELRHADVAPARSGEIFVPPA